METREMTIGQATYTVGHAFLGTKSLRELLLNRLTQQALAEPDFDETMSDAV